MFSGGAASWGTARRIVDEGLVDDLVLVFTDTKTEDEDLYRFLDEAAADIGVVRWRVITGDPERDRQWDLEGDVS